MKIIIIIRFINFMEIKKSTQKTFLNLKEENIVNIESSDANKCPFLRTDGTL